MVLVLNMKIGRIFLLLAVIYFIVGCVPQRELGNKFLNQRHNITLVITTPKWLKMVNLNTDSIVFKDGMTQREKDSVSFYKSKVLQNIKDSVFIANYVKGLRDNLEYQGYKTLVASVGDTIFPVKGDAFLLNLGQIELDEMKYPIRDEKQYFGQLYAYDYDLTKVDMCFWLELYKIDNGVAVEPSRILYDSVENIDDFDGYFFLDPKSNSMKYIKTVKVITADSIQLFARVIGIDHGYRLNEFLLNEYISNFLPANAEKMILGVNPIYGTLERIESPPFEEIEKSSY